MPYTLEQDGFEIRSGILNDAACEECISAIASVESVTKSGRAGRRNLLAECQAIEALAHSLTLRELVQPILGESTQPVRVLFFDKQPDANWGVPWHQDLAIAVAEQIDAPDYTGWSVKDGVPHVHPPVEVLEQMLTLRIHLDECTESNGPLRVIPQSHRVGKFSAEEIRQWQTREPVTCVMPRGGVLLMRPLLLHASSPALQPKHRRIIHIEYAAMTLPSGLRWYAAVDSSAAIA